MDRYSSCIEDIKCSNAARCERNYFFITYIPSHALLGPVIFFFVNKLAKMWKNLVGSKL